MEMNDIETEANVFAMELLMSEEMVRRDVAQYKEIEKDPEVIISMLAERYKVSKMIMTIRLTKLGYFGGGK
jgi:Zn-dependent peptidase ImmA (M78 family)